MATVVSQNKTFGLDSSEEDDVAKKLEREDKKREDEEEEKWSRDLMKHLNIEENCRDGIEKRTSVHPDPGGESKRSIPTMPFFNGKSAPNFV